MISVRGLTKHFGKTVAVNGLDFTIDRGRVVGLLGQNGAGKTTTIRLITGYLPPTKGEVRIDDLKVAKYRQRIRRMIGYLPESTPLYDEMRVREFLTFRARLFGLTGKHRRQAIDRAVRRCWLDEVRRKPIHQLSKGYRQRVGLAAAMLHEPPILILDEPTSGLDPAQVKETRSLIRELAGNHTILLSSHILAEVELTCEEVIMLSGGKISAAGQISDLKNTLGHSATYVVETDSPEAAEHIQAMKQVRSVQSEVVDKIWHRLTITGQTQREDLRQPIAQNLADQGCQIRELYRQSPSLEQLFLAFHQNASEGNSVGTPSGQEITS